MKFVDTGHTARTMRSGVAKARGCRCHLSGYRSVTLQGYVRATLQGFGETAVPAGTPALIPVSDRRAVENAVKLFRGRTVAGFLGDTKQAQGAASMAATGAKVGSIIPGIGTVIGAVVGAVVGWLAGKSKPVRASSADIQRCQSLTTEFMGYAAQYPREPLPLELDQIKDLYWCMLALHGGMVKAKDPRHFLNGWEQKVAMAKSIVRKVYETPVGATVQIDGLSFRDAKGKQINLQGTSFVNQPFMSIEELADRVYRPIQVAECSPWGGGQCQPFYEIPLVKRVVYELLAYAARTELPNISEADLREASKVAATVGTSASSVVQAVEQIIGKTVERNETAELLRPGSSTEPPPVSTSAPGITTGPPSAPASQVAPGPQPLPISEQQATDTRVLIDQLLQQGRSQSETLALAMQQMKNSGYSITPAVTEAVKTEIQSATPWWRTPWAIGGGVFVLLGVGYVLMKRRRR